MELGLTDQVALVVGASRGIGAAIATTLAAEGCNLYLTHLGDGRGARDVAARVEALGREVEVEDVDASDFGGAPEVLDAVLERFGRFDILVYNAGITADAVIWNLAEEAWDVVLDVNLKGCFSYARAAAIHFRTKQRGKIVTVASINGLRGKFGQTNYAASKGGMIAFTAALARELGRFDVNVNAVAPGMVDTELTREIPQEYVTTAREETVLGRIATVDDVANVVAFLCSDRARHITGECVRIDGGQAIGC